MEQPFNAHHVPETGGPTVVLVNGRTFTVARADGSIREPSDGTVFEDLRILNRFAYSVADPADPHPRRHLDTAVPTPFSAVSVSQPDPRAPASEGEPTEYYVHRQWVGRGVRHDISVHNAGRSPIHRELSVELGTDYAHIFDVKAGHPHGEPAVLVVHIDRLVLAHRSRPDVAADVHLVPPAQEIITEDGTLVWHLTCAPRETVTVTVAVEPRWDDRPAGLLFPAGSPVRPAAAVPRPAGHDVATITTSAPGLAAAFDRALIDMASLRIYDPGHPERVVIAAGAPWFMTLFGRDSLLSAWMALPFEPDLALGVLSSLADLQGTATDPTTEEEPGKIIHELRRHSSNTAFGRRGRYFGTVDATPLFVMLAAEVRRWRHLDDELLATLWPHVGAAVGWVRRKLAQHPSGFVHYERSTPGSLLNQGWKDSGDGITFADGTFPVGPVALAEVQGYAYAALLGAAELAEDLPAPGLDPDDLRREAAALRRRFNTALWHEPAAAFALGVTADGRLLDVVTTNPGHALWCGIADDELAHRYLERCCEDLFTGWGLRTLSPTAAAYNPISYHNGSVWPHDTALVAAGAARYGHTEAVRLLAAAAVETTGHFEGRPPELFAGIARDEVPAPVTYPGACSPQAWASASTLLHLRNLAGLDPERIHSRLAADGAGPVELTAAAVEGPLSVRGVRFAHRSIEVHTVPT